MHTLPFAEYRCNCGRLLFKGLVLSGHVQVKCKRCSELVLFDQSSCVQKPGTYSLLVDPTGHIKDASVSAMGSLGYSREALCTMTIHDMPQTDCLNPEVTPISTPEPLEVYVYRPTDEVSEEK